MCISYHSKVWGKKNVLFFKKINTFTFTFSRHFYPKRLTVHSGYTGFFNQYVCSLGIEPTTFCAANAMLYHWATGTLCFNHHFRFCALFYSFFGNISLENMTMFIQLISQFQGLEMEFHLKSKWNNIFIFEGWGGGRDMHLLLFNMDELNWSKLAVKTFYTVTKILKNIFYCIFNHKNILRSFLKL